MTTVVSKLPSGQ